MQMIHSLYLICFENFYKASGLKMNTSRTRVVWVGKKRHSNQIHCPDFKLDWSVCNFKLLGIYFSLDLSTMPDLNFGKKIIDVSKILQRWQHRKLTLLGKVTVIKTHLYFQKLFIYLPHCQIENKHCLMI